MGAGILIEFVLQHFSVGGLQCCLFPGTDPEGKLSLWYPSDVGPCSLGSPGHQDQGEPTRRARTWFPSAIYDLLLRQADVQAYLRFLRCVTLGFMQNIGLDKNNKGTVTHFPAFVFSLISNLS